MTFNNREQLEDFNIRILIFQQEIILSGETVSPIRLLFQFMKALSESNKLKAFIAPKMKDLVTFLDNDGKLAVYTAGNIHGLSSYLEIIVSPTTLTTSGRRCHHFVPKSSINNDTETLHPFVSALFMR